MIAIDEIKSGFEIVIGMPEGFVQFEEDDVLVNL